MPTPRKTVGSSDGQERYQSKEVPYKIHKGLKKFTLPSGRGTIENLSAGRAEVRLNYTVTTSMVCPCGSDNCSSNVRLGRYWLSGDGRRRRPHCKQGKKGGGFFRGESDFKRHLLGEKCQNSRKEFISKETAAKLLGPHLQYEISNPSYREVWIKDGVSKNLSVCPKCQNKTIWTDRFNHSVLCYPRYGVQLPGTRLAHGEVGEQGSV